MIAIGLCLMSILRGNVNIGLYITISYGLVDNLKHCTVHSLASPLKYTKARQCL